MQHVRELLRMVVAEPCTAPAAPNRQAVFRVFRLRRVKVHFEVMYHAVARIAVRSQERMVVSNAVETLADLFLVETLALITRRKRLDRALLALDVFLNLASRATFGVYFLGRDGYEIIAEELEGTVLLQHAVHSSDGFDTGKAEHVLDLGRLAILQHSYHQSFDRTL